MPQKKAKKAKVEKLKKPVKTDNKAAKGAGLGAALKKAAKDIGKKVGLSPVKKAVPTPVKKGSALAKVEKPAKKIAAPLPVKGKKAATPPVLSIVKGKKEAAPAVKVEKPAKAVPAAKIEGKKKGEVVVVEPASKVIAILTKEGKKKGKSGPDSSASKKNRCREPGCDLDFTLVGYCRMHYIKNWRRIKRKEGILASGQLNNYVEELVNKYPDKYLDVIREDLATEKQWNKVVTDLELEGADEDAAVDDDNEAAPEGVRPASGGGGGRGEFDDEGDAF